MSSYPYGDKKKIKAVFCYDIGVLNTAASSAYIKDGKVIGLKNVMLGDNEYTIRSEMLLPRKEKGMGDWIDAILAPSADELEFWKDDVDFVANFKQYIPQSTMTSSLNDPTVLPCLNQRGGVANAYTAFLKLVDRAVRDRVAGSDYPHFRQWYCTSTKQKDQDFNELLDEEKAEKFRQWWDTSAAKEERLYVLTYPAAWKDGKGYLLINQIAKGLGWNVYFEHEVNAAMAHYLHSAQGSLEHRSSYILGQPLIVCDGGGHKIDQAYYQANELDSQGYVSCETCLVHPDLISTAGTAIDKEATKYFKRSILRECIRRGPLQDICVKKEVCDEFDDGTDDFINIGFSSSQHTLHSVKGDVDDLKVPLSLDFTDDELWARVVSSANGELFTTGLKDYEKQWQSYIKTLTSSTTGRKTFFSKFLYSTLQHRVRMDNEQVKVFLQSSVEDTIKGIEKIVKMVQFADKATPKLLILTGGMANIQPYRYEVEKKLKTMQGYETWQCDLAPNNHAFSSGKPVAFGGVLLGLSQQGCGDGIKKGIVPVHYGYRCGKYLGDPTIQKYVKMTAKQLEQFGLSHDTCDISGHKTITGFAASALAKGSEINYNAAIIWNNNNLNSYCSSIEDKDYIHMKQISQSEKEDFPILAKDLETAGIYRTKPQDRDEINELAVYSINEDKTFWEWNFYMVVYLLTANPAVGIKFENKPDKIYWMEKIDCPLA